jgi:hypothetical protein
MTSRKFGTEAFIFLLSCLLVAVFVIFVLIADERKWFRDWNPTWREAALWGQIAAWFLTSRALLRKVRRILERKDLEAADGAPKN